MATLCLVLNSFVVKQHPKQVCFQPVFHQVYISSPGTPYCYCKEKIIALEGNLWNCFEIILCPKQKNKKSKKQKCQKKTKIQKFKKNNIYPWARQGSDFFGFLVFFGFFVFLKFLRFFWFFDVLKSYWIFWTFVFWFCIILVFPFVCKQFFAGFSVLICSWL